jgi:apolipoprotein N-acyltransferase
MSLMNFSKPFTVIAGIIFSGLCWYLSCGLNGDYWWLLWIAPIPVLLISLQLSAGKAFIVSFLAYLIGRMSWLAYLLSVVPVLPTILFTVLLPLIFALTVLITRKVILKSAHWTSIFVFPVCSVAFEYLFFLLSRDGTIGSLAYTQSNFTPIIQIAAVTGITGITFLLCLFPSAITVIIHYWNNKKIRNYSITVTAALLTLVFIFSLLRLENQTDTKQVVAGMTIIPKKLHFGPDVSKTENTAHIIQLYAEGISNLAKQGAQVVVLPEKIITISNSNADTLTRMLKEIATTQHVSIVIGYTCDHQDRKTNNCMVISAAGEILSDYEKVNLFEGEVYEGFVPGKNISLFNLDNLSSGAAICKDMDFQQYMRKYGKQAKILYVPAWDFIKDDWLHSRMAILRGVENGYGIIRNAMEGRLTISDDRGRVLHETSCSNGLAASLIGTLPVRDTRTFYSIAGDWFSIICVAVALWFAIFLTSRKRVDR